MGHLNSYHSSPKKSTVPFHFLSMCLKITGWMTDSVDPDQMINSAASDLGLHCLLMPVCPNTWGYYGNILWITGMPCVMKSAKAILHTKCCWILR